MPINWPFRNKCKKEVECISIIILFGTFFLAADNLFSSNTNPALSSNSVMAQNGTLSNSTLIIEPLFENATNSLMQNNTSDAKRYLDLIQSSIETLGSNTSIPLDNTKFLLGNTIDSVKRNNISEALIYLNLANTSIPVELSTDSNNKLIQNSIVKTDFKTYTNPFQKVQIEYPKNWTLVEYPYNAQSNNTIVGFFSNQKTSSQLGNVSGVSGNFIPYVDLYEFDSKNRSLYVISESIKDQFNNETNFAVDDSRLISMSDGREGFEIVYDVIVGREEHLKKFQAYTIIDDKVYTISFTSQRDLFDEYLPSISYMISSFGPINNTS